MATKKRGESDAAACPVSAAMDEDALLHPIQKTAADAEMLQRIGFPQIIFPHKTEKQNLKSKEMLQAEYEQEQKHRGYPPF